MEVTNQRGQTLVEYILLLSVAISLILTFYNSKAFQRLFGSGGAIGLRIKQESEYSYRHAYGLDYQSKQIPSDISPFNRSISIHPSYVDIKNSGTRFFGPQEPYQ